MSAFAIGGAVIGGALGLFQSRSQNEATARAVRSRVEGINDQLTRARVRGRLTQTSLNAVGKSQIDSAAVRLYRRAEGQSVASMLADASQRLTRSSISLAQETEDAVTTLQRQRQAAIEAGKANIQSPFLAVAQGAMTGAIMGSQLGEAFRVRADAKTIAAEQADQALSRLKISDTALAMAWHGNRGMHSAHQASQRRLSQSQSQFEAVRSTVEGYNQILQRLESDL